MRSRTIVTAQERSVRRRMTRDAAAAAPERSRCVSADQREEVVASWETQVRTSDATGSGSRCTLEETFKGGQRAKGLGLRRRLTAIRPLLHATNVDEHGAALATGHRQGYSITVDECALLRFRRLLVSIDEC